MASVHLNALVAAAALLVLLGGAKVCVAQQTPEQSRVHPAAAPSPSSPSPPVVIIEKYPFHRTLQSVSCSEDEPCIDIEEKCAFCGFQQGIDGTCFECPEPVSNCDEYPNEEGAEDCNTRCAPDFTCELPDDGDEDDNATTETTYVPTASNVPTKSPTKKRSKKSKASSKKSKPKPKPKPKSKKPSPPKSKKPSPKKPSPKPPAKKPTPKLSDCQCYCSHSSSSSSHSKSRRLKPLKKQWTENNKGRHKKKRSCKCICTSASGSRSRKTKRSKKDNRNDEHHAKQKRMYNMEHENTLDVVPMMETTTTHVRRPHLNAWN